MHPGLISPRCVFYHNKPPSCGNVYSPLIYANT
nr:MAG TPA: hypothetical protein [Caudoviricetes sp.]